MEKGQKYFTLGHVEHIKRALSIDGEGLSAIAARLPETAIPSLVGIVELMVSNRISASEAEKMYLEARAYYH